MMPTLRLSTASLPATLGLWALGVFSPASVWAACTSLPNASCSGTTNATIGSGPSTASGAIVTINAGAVLNGGNANAISLGNNVTITVNSGADVRNTATNTGGNGLWSAGKNVIEFDSNGTLTIAESASVRALGTATNAEAINLIGAGNTVINRGLISGLNSAAIWFEDKTLGSNTIDNYGTIQRGSGDASVVENVIGNQSHSDVNFINRSGAVVYGGLSFASGNDTLTLFPGSVISGGFNGGGGTNALILNGTAGSSDTLPGNISNFQTLTKAGEGIWTLTGSVGTNSGTPLAVRVQQGTLALTGNNTGFNGSVVVDPAGILQARAQSLPPSVTDNGLVHFVQPDNGTYSGVISGSGAVLKTGAGVLTLSGANTYAGGTTIQGGTIAVNADNRLGAASGPIILDGGTLELTSSFNLSPSRAITITANDGTIQTDSGVSSTVSQGITGAGSLTKAGPGQLILTGTNSYAEGTTITGGTLQLGNGGTTGSIVGNVVDNGTLIFNRSDSVTFGGTITGTGGITQAGSGITILTANNDYNGPTNVTAGILYINGNQTNADGATTVSGTGQLGGVGIIGGNTTLGDNTTLRPGTQPLTPGTLTIDGALTLSANSRLFYNVVQAGVAGGALNDLTQVNGALVLDGVINILDQGQTLGPGVYRIINYTGGLTNNGLTIGAFTDENQNPTGRALPAEIFVQTSIASQVNLVNPAGLNLNYWDVTPKNSGTIDGGTGTWHSAQAIGDDTNWTRDPQGDINAPWNDGSFAVFTATPGTVTVNNAIAGQVRAIGMQFASNGYTVTGDPLTLLPDASAGGVSTIRVGDGTPAGAGVTATIGSVLQGNTVLQKTDLGTLILTAANTYSGGTNVLGGVLQISADNNLGASGSALSLNGGTLRTTANIDTPRTTMLGSGGGVIETINNSTLTLQSAVGGAGRLTKAGDGTAILAAANTYSGDTTISAGTLQVGNGGTTGSILGDVVDNGTLAFNRSDVYTFGGAISGTGAVNQIGIGVTVLTNTNTYTGGTTISGGVLQLGNGGTTGSIVGNVTNNGTLVFNRSDQVTFAGTISGTGSVVQAGSGVTVLTGNNSYTGPTTISNGWLFVDGNQSTATGPTTAASGTRLGGNGIVGGSVTIADGATLAPGPQPQTPATLTINGNLNLNPSSILFYNMIEAGVAGGARNDLTVVQGNLVLDGVINIADEGQTLGPGVYRVINYTGSLTIPNDGLQIGSFTTVPATPQDGPPVPTRPLTGFSVQTTIPNQVNLVNTGGLTLNYWDVTPKNSTTIDGGTGTWQDTPGTLNDNWTGPDGVANAPWADGAFAIFTATPGIVTVDNSLGPVTTRGMQFASDGYLVTGQAITLQATSTGNLAFIRVGDGTSTGAAITATIAAQLTGNARLMKDDLGTLVLQGANTYTSGTGIVGGTLQISSDQNLGAASGLLAITNGSTLRTTTTFATNRLIGLDRTGAAGVASGTIETAAATEFTVNGVIVGPGSLVKAGTGSLILTNTNTYAGGTTINAGTLQLGNGGTSGSIVGDVVDNGTLAFNRADTYVFGGVVSGTGQLTQIGAGTTVLTNTNTYTGGTTISAGILQLGNGGTTGSIVGDVVDNGTLAFNRADTYVFGGVVSGTGQLTQIGAGTTVLTNTNTYTGGTTISAGTLQIGDGGTTGSIIGDVVDNGTLAFNRSNDYTFAGLISGDGQVDQIGTGTTILTGDSTYTGRTTIASGVLQLGDGGTTGSIVGPIVDNAVLAVNHSNEVILPGQITGTGVFIQQGTGTTVFTANNTYSGGTTIAQGTLQLGNGGSSGNFFGNVFNNGTLAFERNDLLPFTGNISGSGNVVQQGTGDTVLFGTNSYSGTTDVVSGRLFINGDQTAATGLTTAQSGTTLGGTGIIGGSVFIANGATLEPGDIVAAPGTLTIKQDLTLNTGSALAYQFGQANVVGGPFNDLTVVEGNLTLDGAINVGLTEGGAFDVGIYRIISYAGSLNNGTLDIGSIPAGTDPVNYFVQTSVANQVNLAYTAGLALNFWDGNTGPKDDGVVNGGDGIWQAAGSLNDWTNALGVPNAAWADAAFAIFMAAPGTVSVDESLGEVRASGMQFASDGYLIQGDPITLVDSTATSGSSLIRVGDGSSLGSGYTATIASQLRGEARLVKTDIGTLVLEADNTYTGGTAINGGVLQISRDANLGQAGTALGLNDGTLRTTATFATSRDTTLGDLGGTFETLAGTRFTQSGVIAGAGDLTKSGAGIAILTGANSYLGITDIVEGGLYINGDQSAATGLATAHSGGTLGGTGTLGGNVTIAGGGILSPGDVGAAPGTLSINGNLLLDNGAALAYSFGQANVVGGPFNDLTVVQGNLTLDGRIDVALTEGGSFDVGIYRIISYAGALTDRTLDIGSIPAGTDPVDYFVQTSVANQVNLAYTAGLALNFWDGDAGPKNDGVVNGGNGIWQAAGSLDNWTNALGVPNAPWADAAFAIFMATPGTVSVDESLGEVRASGMQFASDGYRLHGDAITLVGTDAVIRVGDGSSLGSGYTATISSQLRGEARLVKTDLGTLTLTAANTYSGGSTISAGTLQLGDGGTSGSILGDVTNNGTLAFKRSDTYTFGGVISGSGGVQQTGTGTTVLTAANTYSGPTSVTTGTLRAGAAGTFSPASAVSVASGAVLDLNGFDQAVAGLINGGRVRLDGAPGTVLRVAGDYTGASGILALNTVLGGDASPSDKLVIDGGRGSGNTTLAVTHVGGRGAKTAGDGILLVEAVNGATTTPGAFALAGPAIAGPYEYSLFRGGLGGGAPDNWFLRSTLDCTLAPFASVCHGDEPPPAYRPETSLYSAIPALALNYGNLLLDTLDQRMGALRSFRRPASGNDPGHLAWGRVFGLTGTKDGGKLGIYGGEGPSYDYTVQAIQVGTDLYRVEHEDGGFDNTGLYFAYGRNKADVRHFDRTDAGSARLDAWTIGGYWTHFGAAGWYLDGILQGSGYDVTASGRLPDLQTDGLGLVLSLEGGYPFRFANGLVLEPQAQLSYQAIDLDGARDPAAQIRFGNVHSLVGRLGARLSQAWTLNPDAAPERQRTLLGWVRPSITNEFLGQPRTAFSSDTGPVPFQANLRHPGLKVDAGVDAEVGKDVSLYGNIAFQKQLDGDDYAIGGEFGIKVRF